MDGKSSDLDLFGDQQDSPYIQRYINKRCVGNN